MTDTAPRILDDEPTRKASGRPSRLTETLAQRLVDDVATGNPIAWCCAAAGIDHDTYKHWRRTATQALSKTPSQRSQFQRRCVRFSAAIDQAVGLAAQRMRAAVANAAGLGDTLPVRTRTTQRIVGATLRPDGTVQGGRVVDIIVERITVPADWRPAMELLKRRFPEEMGDRGTLELTGKDGGPIDIGLGEFKGELSRIRDARAAKAKGLSAAAELSAATDNGVLMGDGNLPTP